MSSIIKHRNFQKQFNHKHTTCLALRISMSISLTIAKCLNINHKTHLIIDSSFTLIKIIHYMVDTSFGAWFNMGFYFIFYNLYSYRMVRAEKPEDKMRARRTNIMLFTISMVFCVAWLPLNLIGILLDQIKLFGDNIELAYLTYVACHLVCIYSKIIIRVTFSHILQNIVQLQFFNDFIQIVFFVKQWISNSKEWFSML